LAAMINILPDGPVGRAFILAWLILPISPEA
jgi:hypothetical protein